MGCASCRAELANVSASISTTQLRDQQAVWDGVLERVDRPTRSITERLLGVLRVRPDTAKLLATTPALRLAWLAAVVFVAAFAVAAGRMEGDGPWLLLVIAPLLPVAGVATAYGPALDPTYEIGVAAPLSGLRLTLLRTLAVIATHRAAACCRCACRPRWRLDGVRVGAAIVRVGRDHTRAVDCDFTGTCRRASSASGWLVALVVLIDRDEAGDVRREVVDLQSRRGRPSSPSSPRSGSAIVASARPHST